jgi:hypothetical protein
MASIAASIGALAMWATLASPAQAQDGPALAAAANEAAGALQLSLDHIAKTAGRPDFSAPPLADQLSRVFDLKDLTALPPAKPEDLPWIMDWAAAANRAYKSILFFGIAPPVTLQTDPAALQRNITDYEDQEAAAVDFMLHIVAREIPATFAFMDQLPPAQRTPVRVEGLNKMRVANAETVISYVGWIAAGMKPANARLVSAAIRDTGAEWATAIFPADRPAVLAMLDKAEAAAKDDETRNNLSAFGSLLANAK